MRSNPTQHSDPTRRTAAHLCRPVVQLTSAVRATVRRGEATEFE